MKIVLSGEFRRSVEANLGADPMRIALDSRVPHAALVATQVKYLNRARLKLPSYYSARCILPPLAFEQSSSEATAARKEYSGGLAIDLTCGLGVDSFWLSKRFERVIAVERDVWLAEVARENFRRLGTDNILVVNASAEEFLTGEMDMLPDFDGRADLVYADPDRRNAEGKKMVRIEDCSPDIATLLPQIQKMAPRLVVKLSPLFDVDELFRVFGSNTREEAISPGDDGNVRGNTISDRRPSVKAEVISLGGECKEIVADIRFVSQADPAVRAVAIGVGEMEYPYGDSLSYAELPFEPERYRYLIIPDVALQKAKLARRYLSERGAWIDSDNGYGFVAEKPDDIMGKIIEIENIEPFDPKGLKRRLKAQGIKNLDILKRDFPLSAADIARQAGVLEGGTRKIAFTRVAGRLLQIALKR